VKVLVSGSFPQSLVNFRGPLIRELGRRGHEVVALAPGSDDRTIATLRDWGVRFVPVELDRTGTNPLRDLGYFLQMRRIVGRERPDAILAYTIKPIVHGMFAAWLGRVPIRAAMVEGSGYAFGTRKTRRQRLVGAVARMLYRVSLARATVVFFLNPDDRDEFASRGMVDPARSRLIAGTGVDLDHYRVAPVPTGPPAFLTIARLNREKGVADFAAAARIVRARYPEARFRVLGPFDQHPDAVSKDEIAASEAEGTVEYLGVTDDVRPYLAACTVFVLPSYYREGLPRTSLEALATGRAVVTTDGPGCREAVEDGKNGFLVPPRDPQALAATLMRFCADPSLAVTMGQASHQLARTRFEVGGVNRDILQAMGVP
jgi:glycosyltransferase involved in cell wall biosynthesis